MANRFYSIVVPVYNRPQELRELLESLTKQTYTHFEVVVIEDGSLDRAEEVAKEYSDSLEIHYFYKENTGQGLSRNYGYDRANGDYFVVFDSDCLIPSNYLEIVNNWLDEYDLDAYGGPDRDHPTFTRLQKAISYSMTSFFTTGGIRGRKKRVGGAFHPRSFNMGISKAVYQATGGYRLTKMGEDIELSIRIIEKGFKVGLIPDAYVYHKRRTSLRAFYKQLHFFGRARINISRIYPGELKLVHFFPACFTLALGIMLLSPVFSLELFRLLISGFLLYALLILIDATIRFSNPVIGLLSVAAAFTQLVGYGVGFITEGIRKLLGKPSEYSLVTDVK